MCGICGILTPAKAGTDAEAIIGRMMDRLAHRGPDGRGTWSGGGVAFGHTRLAIIDLAGGAQPMKSGDGRYVLVFNGEIYNYIELKKELASSGVEFRTSSDTEVLLQMLIRHGKEALGKLNGMFAFAFHDTRTGEWLLGRDPFGIKPLYYAQLGDEVVFASEIKSILAHPRVRPERNDDALRQYLTFQLCMDDRTLFKGISAVEPGHGLEGKGGKVVRSFQYWDTDYRIDEDHTENYFVEQLRHLLEDSARLQIRSDVPLGAYLSGGIDSSVVTLLAVKHLGSSIPVFTGKFAEGPQYDESSFAKMVADSGGCQMRTVTPTAKQFVEDLPKLIFAMDEPAAGPSLFPQYHVSKLAAGHVKVMLGGQGGDEIFGGYARYLVGYLEQALKGAIFETQEEGKHLVTLASIIPNLPMLQQYQPLMQQFWRDGLFGEMDARYFRLIDRSPDIEHLLTAEALAGFDRKKIFEEFRSVFNHPDTKSYVNKMTHFDLKTLLPSLLQIEDRMSMAVSLESRVPFLDTRVVNLVTTMPPPMKFQDGRSKNILKKAVGDLLPKKILHRKDKMGFPVPLSEWMRGGPARDFVRDTLLGKASRERGLFEPKALEKLIESESQFGRQLWGVLCLELWHQQYLDRK